MIAARQWLPATLGAHEGAERVEAQRLELGDVRYRHTPDGVIFYGGRDAVRFLTPREALRESLEQAAADVASWPPSLRAAVGDVWAATGGRAAEPEPAPPEPVHPAPWWYRLASRLAPARCREIPEAQNPGRVLLRQAAIVLRSVYLQGFASGEDKRWYHAHGRWLLVLGLWGGYTERRPGCTPRRVRAPYVYAMHPAAYHQVSEPTPGHTSIAIMWGKGERTYAQPRSWQEHTPAGARVKRV
jgi:hypothetical protein